MKRTRNLSFRLFSTCLYLFIAIFLITSCATIEKEPGETAADSEPAPDSEEGASEPGVNAALQAGLIRAEKIRDRRDLCLGIWAQGGLGDYVLENEKVRAVIAAPENVYMGVQGGGHIIDLCRKEYAYDYIRGLYARIGDGAEPTYEYKDIRVRTTGYEDDGAAIIVSGESVTEDQSYELETEYLLKPGQSHIEITTTVRNTGSGPLSELALGEIAMWGGCSQFIGAQGVVKYGQTMNLDDAEWFSAFRDDFSAGFTIDDGPISGVFYNDQSRVVYRKAQAPPGGEVSYKRYLVVSDKNISQISDFAYRTRLEDFGFITGTVVNYDTEEPVSDVDVRFIINRRGDEVVPARPFTRTFSDENGYFEVIVPEGSYFVQTEAFARRSQKKRLSFYVPAGDTYVLKLNVSRLCQLKVTCRDEDTDELLPCKLTFENIPPTDPVDQGPGVDLTARNVYYCATGDEVINVPTGRYKVIFSRGIEYDTYSEEALFAVTLNNRIDAKLKRVVDTEGYVCADPGVRTNRSWDSYVTPEDRVVTAACEGVEYLVSGDSNQATDLAPAVSARKLDSHLKTGVGKRIEFMGTEDLGDFLVFPLSPEGRSAAASNEELETTEADEFFEILREKYPESLISVQRAIFPQTGYFTNYGYDHEEKRLIEDEDFTYDFDLLEIWEGKRMGAIEETVKLAFDCWLTGHTGVVPSAGSFSHDTWGEEVGYPRVYVKTETDEPSRLTDEMIREGFQSGNVFVTNGPIINFTVNGMPPGSLVTDTDGEVVCNLEIYAAPWVPVSFVDINLDGVFLRRSILPPSDQILRYPKGERPEGEDEGFKVKIQKDSIINVQVVGSGREGLEPVVPTPFLQRSRGGVKTFALTAPIYVDFDGNGEYDPPPEDLIGM